MTKTTKNIIAVILTYGITRWGYWLVPFRPWDGHSFLVGAAVDLSIWTFIYFAIVWLLNKFVPTKVGAN